MDISYDTSRLLAEKDERRMKEGDAAAKIEAQRHRKEHTLHRWQQARAEDARDGDVYGAGAHEHSPSGNSRTGILLLCLDSYLQV